MGQGQAWDHGTVGPWGHGAARLWRHGTVGYGAAGPWDHGAVGHGAARQTRAFGSLPRSGKSVAERETFYGGKWRNGASLQASKLLLGPENVL